MPKPMSLCIENLEPHPGVPKYVRCVALPGGQPGLSLGLNGAVLWESDETIACELWASGDDRLILYRPEGAVPVALRRAGRSLDVPCSKPVVVIDQDEIDVGARRLRVHVHGVAPVIAAPSIVAPERGVLRRLVRAAAAALAIVSAVPVGGCTAAIEVRDHPPKMPPPSDAQPEGGTDAPDESPEADTQREVPDDNPASRGPSGGSDAPS